MSEILSERERAALSKISATAHKAFKVKGELVGVGRVTLASLELMGLVETGQSPRHYGEIGWRVTDDGWRCMYGATYAEIMAKAVPVHPLRVWRWPME